ncbi:MAG: hypothetical protein HY298_26565 [Verrucomicrobia bacterium]|nr:hypothetical protein [Verrucomicrobiota bacterium]
MVKIVTTPEWDTLLSAHHLNTVAGVYALNDDAQVIKRSDSSEVRRAALPHGTQVHTLIIKKYWVTKTSQLWSGFWRGTFLGRSKVRREFENLERLRVWGLDAPAPVAYGEERRARWLRRAFLISECVAEPLPLDLFIRDHLPSLPDAERGRMRRELIQRLADYTKRLHTHHFVHHDYFWRNIILSGKRLTRFFLIDAHKGRVWPSWAAQASRAKDLATLDTPATHFFRRTERLRFFLRYVGHDSLTKEDKKLLRRALRIASPLRERQYRRVERAQRLTARERG